MLSCARPPGTPAGHHIGRPHDVAHIPPLVTSLSALALAAAGLTVATGSAHAATCSQAYLPAGPQLPARRPQPGRHPVHHRLHDLRLRLDRDRTALQLVHHRPEEEADRRVRLHRHQHLGLRGRPLRALELGGAPKSELNLWPEPQYGTKTAANKDTVENKLKKAVCAGTVSLSDAQDAIINDWTTALSDLGLS